jgi:hypothetical protein
MAPKYDTGAALDSFARAAFVNRQEATAILHAQLLLCQLVTHQEDPLSGCYIASQSSNCNLKLWQVTKSSPKATTAGARPADMLQHCHKQQQQRKQVTPVCLHSQASAFS